MQFICVLPWGLSDGVTHHNTADEVSDRSSKKARVRIFTSPILIKIILSMYIEFFHLLRGKARTPFSVGQILPPFKLGALSVHLIKAAPRRCELHRSYAMLCTTASVFIVEDRRSNWSWPPNSFYEPSKNYCTPDEWADCMSTRPTPRTKRSAETTPPPPPPNLVSRGFLVTQAKPSLPCSACYRWEQNQEGEGATEYWLPKVKPKASFAHFPSPNAVFDAISRTKRALPYPGRELAKRQSPQLQRQKKKNKCWITGVPARLSDIFLVPRPPKAKVSPRGALWDREIPVAAGGKRDKIFDGKCLGFDYYESFSQCIQDQSAHFALCHGEALPEHVCITWGRKKWGLWRVLWAAVGRQIRMSYLPSGTPRASPNFLRT